MLYHVKDLQFNARVERPDPRFAGLLLEQFGGPNGELKAAMQYFVQAFPARKPYPEMYDMLMDIAMEEFSHLEIVGATIQMLLNGVGGELKNAADNSEINALLDGKDKKEDFIHWAMVNPQFFALSGGGPILSDSQGNPWQGSYVTANGDLTVDLRSNIAAESRAKIVYEYLMKFTNDIYVKETLQFLMTREVAHFQMFEAALAKIESNFPPGVLQADPRYSNKYFNMSDGADVRGPWNEGISPQLGEEWQYIKNPKQHVVDTNGLVDEEIVGTNETMESMEEKTEEISEMRMEEIKSVVSTGSDQWSDFTGDMDNDNSI